MWTFQGYMVDHSLKSPSPRGTVCPYSPSASAGGGSEYKAESPSNGFPGCPECM